MLDHLEPLARTTGAYVFVVVLGLLWGSFANVCIYRWPPTEEYPDGRSVVLPGSHCFACKTPVKWYDNTPLISWLWLRGKCRTCKAPFSARYLIVEALTGALFGVVWYFTVGLGAWFESFDAQVLRFAIYAAFCFVMVVIAFIDLDHQLILNKVTIPSTIVFYGLGLLLPERNWYDGLLGAAIGYGVPWVIGEIYFRLTEREGMGLGDSTMLALIGAFLGWKGVIAGFFGGAMVGSVVGITALLVGRAASAKSDEAKSQPVEPLADDTKALAEEVDDSEGEPSLMKTAMPFGPFIAIATVFYLVAEPWFQLRFR